MSNFGVNLVRHECKNTKKIPKNKIKTTGNIILELVYLGLHFGKVWENRLFLCHMTLVDPYSKLLLRGDKPVNWSKLL